MRKHYKHYTAEEKRKLIIECRQSGLSDYQWCLQNGINNSTFYNWVSKFRNDVCNPAELKKTVPIVKKQEVVKIDLLPDQMPEQATVPVELSPNNTVAIELTLNGCNLKIYNDASERTVKTVLNYFRGAVC